MPYKEEFVEELGQIWFNWAIVKRWELMWLSINKFNIKISYRNFKQACIKKENNS
ncbi:MAG: hypothetical protein PHR96_03890 [Clostridia bacterium]|nr:hypothetical protein [Clostridia bacterium]